MLQEIIVLDVGGGVHTILRELAPHCSYIHSSRICGSACGRGLLAGFCKIRSAALPICRYLGCIPICMNLGDWPT